MGRLRREVAAVIHESASPTREEIWRMPFLACVLKECMSKPKAPGPELF
ncbi:hypothetical protein IMZ48_48305 [Candidatus Bathyarchaeota archaeon]|nr:hypothetical protein [Candidatus Bathyarchaeota archaeon]